MFILDTSTVRTYMTWSDQILDTFKDIQNHKYIRESFRSLNNNNNRKVFECSWFATQEACSFHRTLSWTTYVDNVQVEHKLAHTAWKDSSHVLLSNFAGENRGLNQISETGFRAQLVLLVTPTVINNPKLVLYWSCLVAVSMA